MPPVPSAVPTRPPTDVEDTEFTVTLPVAEPLVSAPPNRPNRPPAVALPVVLLLVTVAVAVASVTVPPTW